MKNKLNDWMVGCMMLLLLGLVACGGEETPTAVATPSATATTAVVVQPFFGTYVVAVDIANLRAGPGPEYELLGQVTQGYELELDGVSEDGDWVRATTGGWLPLGFLDEAPDETPTAVVEATETAVPPEQPSPTFTAVPAASPTLTATVLVTQAVPTSCGPPVGWVIYMVQPGDTLFAIASQTGSSVDALIRANCLTSDRINAGQGLYVPRLPIPTPTFTFTPQPSDTPVVVDSPTPTLTTTPTPLPTATDTAVPVPTDTPTQLPVEEPEPTISATVQPPTGGTP